MYISSDFLNKNAHKFFNSNVEKNDFGGLNRVRFMSGAIGSGAPTYTPYGAQSQQDNKGVTDRITTVIRSPADLQALTKGGNAYLPPDVYAALARGEEVAVTLSQRPPERVNLLVPVFAAFAQMAGSGGAAYNRELGNAIQGVDNNTGAALKGTGLNAAADFVNRFGCDYSLNPFGGATHIDIDAQYQILTKKQDPVKIPPLQQPPSAKQKAPTIHDVDPVKPVISNPASKPNPLHVTPSDTTDNTMQRRDYNDLVGGREYLFPFVSNLEKQGIDVSPLKGANGKVDQKKALALVKAIQSGKIDLSIQGILDQINSKPELKTQLKEKSNELLDLFKKYQLGNTREQEGLQVLSQYEKLDLISGKNGNGDFLLSDNQVKKLVGMSRAVFEKLPPEKQAELLKKLPDSALKGDLHNQAVFQRVDYRDQVVTGKNGKSHHKRDLAGDTEIRDNAPFVSSIPVTVANLNSSVGATRAVTDFLSLGAKAHLTVNIDGKEVQLTQSMIDSAKGNPDALVKLFNASERTLESKYHMRLDGKLGAEHVTEMQRAMIERAQMIDLGSEASFNAGTGGQVNSKALTPLLAEYNSAHPDSQISQSALNDPKNLSTILEYSKSELKALSSSVQGTGYIRHGQMDQMKDDISDVVTGSGKPNSGLDAMIAYVNNSSAAQSSTDSQVVTNQPIVDLSIQASDLSKGIKALAKLYNENTPLDAENQAQLNKLDPSGEKVALILKDPFSSDSKKLAGGLLTNASTRLTDIANKAKELKNPETSSDASIDPLVSQIKTLVDKSVPELNNFIQNNAGYDDSVSNFLLTIENRISDMKSGTININSDLEVDGKVVKPKDYLKKLETDFKDLLLNTDASATLQKQSFKDRVLKITEAFPELNARSGAMAEDFSAVMDGIKNAEVRIYAPKTDAKTDAKPKGTDAEISDLTQSSEPDKKAVGQAMSSLVGKKDTVTADDIKGLLTQLGNVSQNNAKQMFDLADSILERIKKENPSLSALTVKPSEIYSNALKASEQTKSNFDAMLKAQVEDAKKNLFPTPTVRDKTIGNTPTSIAAPAVSQPSVKH